MIRLPRFLPIRLGGTGVGMSSFRVIVIVEAANGVVSVVVVPGPMAAVVFRYSSRAPSGEHWRAGA